MVALFLTWLAARIYGLALVQGFMLVSAAAAPSNHPFPSGYPSPWASGGEGWDEAYAKAKEFVSQLTLVEKVNLTTGTGWEADRW